MKEKSFFESCHCKSRMHCVACRDKNNKNFRTQLYDYFDDIEEIDFTCPFNISWGINKKNIEEKEKLLDFDFIKSHYDLFKNIIEIDGLLRKYEEKIKSNKCHGCVARKIAREINKNIIEYVEKTKDINFLNKFDEDLILLDGKTNKQISEWKKIIKNV